MVWNGTETGLVNIDTVDEGLVIDNVSNTNLLTNSGFDIASPDTTQPPPDGTPRTYIPGFQVRSNWFAGDTYGVSDITYIDGVIAFPDDGFNSLYQDIPKSGDLQYVTEVIASIAIDADGEPLTSGVTVTDNGDSWRVTLTGGTYFSAKLEQGTQATRHESKSLFDIYGHPSVTGEANVKAYGCTGDGSDEYALLQEAFSSGYPVYLPNGNGEQYGTSQPILVTTKQGFSIRADTPKRSSGQVLKALAPMEAVLQLLDGSAVPGENIITLPRFENMSIEGDNKAVFGLACGKFGSTANQLVKMLQAGSLSAARCRFGVLIGGAGVGIETDSAGYGFDNLVLEENTDGAILVDTGNGAAIRLGSATLNNNGFSPVTDSYNPSGEGFNAKVIGGELNMIACTTAGLGDTQPKTADIIASSGDIRIMGLWSDTHGLCIKESGGTDSSHFIGAMRHNEGAMTVDIQTISLTNPMVVQANGHKFTVGNKLTLRDVVGTVEVNEQEYTVTAASTNTVTLDVNATAFTPYVSGGIITSTPFSIEHLWENGC